MHQSATTFVVLLLAQVTTGLAFRFISVSQAWRLHPLPPTSPRWTSTSFGCHTNGRATTTLHDATASSSSSSSSVLYPHVSILLETDRFLVINKPAGVPHHDETVRDYNATTNQDVGLDDETDFDEETNGPTSVPSPSHQLGIVNLLRRQIALERDRPIDTEMSSQVLPYPIPRLYGVHRLDRDTSGILVLAKDAGTAGRLARAFRNGLVVKYYTGLSTHKATVQKQGWVQGQMVRGRRKSWYLTRNTKKNNNKSNHKPANQSTRSTSTDDPHAPYAKTRFYTAGLGHLHAVSSANNTVSPPLSWPRTLILFRPYTGKTHQLRVAAKSVGIPLLGDPIYSDGAGSNVCDAHAMMEQRTYLHATAIHIPAHALDDHDSATNIANQLHHDTDAAYMSSERNGLTVWCLPPFASAWPEETQRRLYETALDALVRKHCDCVELIAAFPSSVDRE